MPDLGAGLDGLHGDDGDLSSQTRIRAAAVIDEVRELVGGQRGEIEALVDLHRVAPDRGRQIVELGGADDASAPHGDELAGRNRFPSDNGLAAVHVTISDYTFFGEIGRRTWAHETSARAR